MSIVTRTTTAVGDRPNAVSEESARVERIAARRSIVADVRADDSGSRRYSSVRVTESARDAAADNLASRHDTLRAQCESAQSDYRSKGTREPRADRIAREDRHLALGLELLSVPSVDGSTPSRLDVITRTVERSTATYIGIDHASLVEQTVDRLAMLFGGWRPVRSPRDPMPYAHAVAIIGNDSRDNDVPTLAGYARRIGRSLAITAATGRGRMPMVLDVERVEGSPNYSPMTSENRVGSWQANNTRGHSYSLVSAIGNPVFGESLVERAIAGGADARDTLALALAIEHADYSLRDSRVSVYIGRGNVFIPWGDVARDLSALGVDCHPTTVATMTRRAITAARRADDSDAIASRHAATIGAIRHAADVRSALASQNRQRVAAVIRDRIARATVVRGHYVGPTDADRLFYRSTLETIARVDQSLRESARADAVHAMHAQRLSEWIAVADRLTDADAVARADARADAHRAIVHTTDRQRRIATDAAWMARFPMGYPDR